MTFYDNQNTIQFQTNVIFLNIIITEMKKQKDSVSLTVTEIKRKVRKYNIILSLIFVLWLLTVGGILGGTLPVLYPELFTSDGKTTGKLR